jgi:hypothetical protein
MADRFEQALGTLSYLPLKCGLAPENGLDGEEIRQLLFGKRPRVFRALFAIAGDEVRVLHIRRATMDTATNEELYG